MTEREKLSRIIRVIITECDNAPERHFIEVHKRSVQLNGIDIEDIENILKKLESKDRILHIKHIIPQPIGPENPGMATLVNQGVVFPIGYEIQLTKEFEPWHKAYQRSRKTTLSDLSRKTLQSALDFLEGIEDAVAVNKSHTLTLRKADFAPIPGNAILELLHNNDVLLDYKLIRDGVKIHIDIDRYDTFKRELKDRLPQKDEPKSISNNIAPSSPNRPNFPPITKWEDISIKFKNGLDVTIKIGNTSIQSDFKQMGFEDGRTSDPDTQWAFLKLLAQSRGQIAWQDSPPSKMRISTSALLYGEQSDEEDEDRNEGVSYIKPPSKLKKQKQLLARSLKAFFGLKDDPFWPYSTDTGYTIRIKLIAA